MVPFRLAGAAHPVIYEINTWPWLAGLSSARGATVDLSCVPADVWDDLASLGARTIYPAAQAGIPFSDGRPPVIIYREDMIEETCKNFAVYSKRDAEA